MMFIILILFIIMIVTFARLFFFKKEVKKLTNQLKNYNDGITSKKLDMALIDKTLENMGMEINRLIDSYVMENRRRVRFEKEHQQAVANMSHDLRTPLTSIKGYIQMAESKDVSEEEKRELLSIAAKRVKRLETLLNDFFELSIIESIDYQLKLERINLRNITINVLMSFYDRLHEKNMVPTISICEEDVFIYADESAITRVIENLLSNALTHSEGNIIVSLEKEKERAMLMVKNDAHSLTEQDAQHMFNRFYMADKSRSGKSTGLGLSIVKSFMEKMDGTITGNLQKGQLTIICTWKLYK